MIIIFLGLFSFIACHMYAAEIEHVMKIQQKDRKKKGELMPLLQQSTLMREADRLLLDIRKIICRNITLMLIDDLNIDRQSYLNAEKKQHSDAERKPANDWNKVKPSSLLWHYYAAQQYMSQNGWFTIGQKALCIHDALQLTSEQRDLMKRASESSGRPLSYWDYMKLQKISPHITEGMTVTINQPVFFDRLPNVGPIPCYRGPALVGTMSGLGTFLSVLGCLVGCKMVPTGVVAVTFCVGISGFTILSCCWCGRKTEDFKKDTEQ